MALRDTGPLPTAMVLADAKCQAMNGCLLSERTRLLGQHGVGEIIPELAIEHSSFNRE